MRTAYQVSAAIRRNPKRTLDFSPFMEHMTNGMPEITPDPIGKFRLKVALKNQFGKHYTNHPVAKQMMDHFERQSKVISKLG